MRTVLLIFILIATIYAKERIITLSPAITEIVFGLGAGDDVVGVSAYSVYPKETAALPKVGGYSNPSFEQILALHPTLVAANSYQARFLQQLEKLGIPTLSLEFKTLDSIKTSIRALAKRLHKDPTPLIEPIDKALIEIQNHAHASKPKVLIVYGEQPDLSRSIYVAGHEIYYEDIIHACGAENAFSQSFQGQPVLHYEGLIASNPDIVIILYSQLTSKTAQETVLKLWESVPINASKNHRIYILDSDQILIPSYRVAKTISQICGAIGHD